MFNRSSNKLLITESIILSAKEQLELIYSMKTFVLMKFVIFQGFKRQDKFSFVSKSNSVPKFSFFPSQSLFPNYIC